MKHVQIKINIPKEMHDKLVLCSEKCDRTPESYILMALEFVLKKDKNNEKS